MFGKRSIIAIGGFLVVALLVFVFINFFTNYKNQDLTVYQTKLLNLSAEEMLYEHFKMINQKNVPKIKETLRSKEWDFEKNELDNLGSIKIIELKPLDKETNDYSKMFSDNAEAMVYDVIYVVQYKNSQPQSDGMYTWRYYLSKRTAEEPWLIDSYGFF